MTYWFDRNMCRAWVSHGNISPWRDQSDVENFKYFTWPNYDLEWDLGTCNSHICVHELSWLLFLNRKKRARACRFIFQRRPERFRLFYLRNTKETLYAAVWESAQNHLLKVLHSHSGNTNQYVFASLKFWWKRYDHILFIVTKNENESVTIKKLKWIYFYTSGLKYITSFLALLIIWFVKAALKRWGLFLHSVRRKTNGFSGIVIWALQLHCIAIISHCL